MREYYAQLVRAVPDLSIENVREHESAVLEVVIRGSHLGAQRGLPARAEAREIIPLLGATGRPQVLPVLFDYIEADAVYDDVEFGRLAANAIRVAAEHISSVAEEPQTRLVTLLDGDECEVDPEAQAALSSALASS